MSHIAGFDSITSIDYQLASARWREAIQERDAALAELEDLKSRDQDETRRLLYMALYADRTERYELVGTLVNALAHHGSGLDPNHVGEQVLATVEGGDSAWVREQIERLTAELESDPTP